MTTGGLGQLNKLKVALRANHCWHSLGLLLALPEDPRRQAGPRAGSRPERTPDHNPDDAGWDVVGKGWGGGSRG